MMNILSDLLLEFKIHKKLCIFLSIFNAQHVKMNKERKTMKSTKQEI